MARSNELCVGMVLPYVDVLLSGVCCVCRRNMTGDRDKALSVIKRVGNTT